MSPSTGRVLLSGFSPSHRARSRWRISPAPNLFLRRGALVPDARQIAVGCARGVARSRRATGEARRQAREWVS